MQKKISNKVSKIGINGRREHLKHNERNLFGKRKKQRGYQPRPNGKTGYSHPRHMPRTRYSPNSGYRPDSESPNPLLRRVGGVMPEEKNKN